MHIANTDGNAALFQSKFLFVLAANQKDCLAAPRDLGYTAGAIGYNLNSLRRGPTGPSSLALAT